MRLWNELEPREQQRWNEVLQSRAARGMSDLARMLIEAGIGEEGKLDVEGATVVSWAWVTVGLSGILCLAPDGQEELVRGVLKVRVAEQLDRLVGLGDELRLRQARSRS